MKRNVKKSYFTVPIVLAVSLILVLSLTFALFTQTVDGTRSFLLSNFTSDAVVYFDGHSTASDPATASGTVGGAKYYTLSLTDTGSPADYIGDLRVSVKYNGKGVGLVRVRILEEWYTENTTTGVTTVLPYSIEMPYFIGNPNSNNGQNNAKLYGSSDSGNQPKWKDNRANDYCFYYATPISNNGEMTIPLVTGLDTTRIDFGAIDTDSTHVRLIVEADVVQVNRYPQYWGINVLPWTSASSATENAT